MTDDQPSRRPAVVPLKPNPDTFLARIQQLAETTANVRWSYHARERMEERGISIRVALTVIRHGAIMGQIEPGTSPGEWKAKIVRNVRGRRDVGVVVILVKDSRLFVKTVEWEDMR